MKIDELMKKEINEEMGKIQPPSSLYEFVKNIKEESEMRTDFEKQTERKKGWRKSQFVAAAVISLGVLTGSAILNPTMAEVVSKIPYLGQIFHKPIPEVIIESLEKEGYKPAGIGMSMWEGKPLFNIELEGTEEYVHQEKDKVLNILTDVLEKRGYDNYELIVSDKNEVSPALNEIVKQRKELGEKLMGDLQLAGYPIINVNAFEPTIKVYIPISDESKAAEIRKAATEFLEANGSVKIVQIITKDVSEDKLRIQWWPVMRSIEEALYMKKEYKVADISYSFKPEKVSITIRTSMKSSDAVAKETVTKIRKEITEFLDSEEIKTKTANQKYELIIQDKSGNDFSFKEH